MLKLVYALADELHGIFAYTVEQIETGLWKDFSVEFVKKDFSSLIGATIDPQTGVVFSPDCTLVLVGTDYTNPNTIGGRLKPGYNDLYTWCKKNNRLDIIQAYLAAQVEGKNSEPMSTIPYHSYKKKAWFKCLTCGHLFEVSPVYLTTRKNFCPACAARVGKSKATITGVNDLETWCRNNNRPDIAADYSPDNPRPISQIAATSHDRVKWVCHKCGFTWEAPVLNRTTQTGNCKACSAREGKGTSAVAGINDLETWCKQNGRQDIIDAWSQRNRIPMSRIGAKTDTIKVYLKCKVCGKEIETTPLWLISSKYPTLCLNCRPQGTSTPQVALYSIIKANFPDALYRTKLQGYEADIFVPSLNLAIEYNGHWHFQPEVIQRDIAKLNTFSKFGITTLTIQEYPNKDVGLSLSKLYLNRIEIWYKINLSIELFRAVLDWITHTYGVSTRLDTEIYDHSLAYAEATMTRQEVPNSIAVTHPEIAAEWDYEHNGNLKPEMFTSGSHKEVYWICNKCSIPHSYKATVRKRCLGRGCPVKAGKSTIYGLNDLASAVPNFIRFCWDFEANSAENLDPTKLSRGSKREIHVKCPYCGHKWIVGCYNIIGFRLRQKDSKPPKCPHCGRQLPFN